MKTSVNDAGHTIWHFTRAELVALLAHMSTDQTRFNLCSLGLNVATGEANATDGHRGVQVRGFREGHDRAIQPGKIFVVGRSFVEQVVKAATKDVEILILCEDPKVSAIVGNAAFEGNLVDVTYPPLDQVMPKVGEAKKHQGTVGGFNANYLADLAVVTSACPPYVKQVGKKKEKVYPTLTLWPGKSDLDPWLATVRCPQNATDWDVCIMPMRI